MLTVAVGLAALLVVQLVMFGMTQKGFLLCAAIVVGAIGWKVFPFEIPHEGQFWKPTGERAKEAATAAGAPAAGVTLLAVLISFLYALATDRNALDTAGSWAGAGSDRWYGGRRRLLGAVQDRRRR